MFPSRPRGSSKSAVKTSIDEDFPRPRSLMGELVGPFDELIKTYPDSWQPKIYLSFVRDHEGTRAVRRPSPSSGKLSRSRMRITNWSHGVRNTPGSLTISRIRQGSVRSRQVVLHGSTRGETGGETANPERTYQPGERGAQIAIELEPESASIIQRLAQAEAVMGDYKTAQERIFRVDRVDRSSPRSEPTRKARKPWISLIEPNYIQCQIAVDWAEDLHAQRALADAKESSLACGREESGRSPRGLRGPIQAEAL